VPQRHATSLAGVGAGAFYFDFAADKIYFATDPTGRRVEAAVARFAFQGAATDVTVRSLVIEKYANFLQQGAVAPNVGTATGWLIEGNEVRLNHGEGVRIGTGARVLRNTVHHQGQLGIGAPGDNVLVDNNEVYANNFAGVDDEFSAGGIKVHGVTGNLSDGITLSNNRVHDNRGRGIWCDFNCIRTVYEGNLVERNTSWGIEQEIGYAAVIRNNTLTGNGGGVFVSTSQDVEVAGNTISGPYPVLGLDQTRGTGYYGALVLANLNVHDNTITPTTGSVGVLQTSGTDAAFTSRNNRFDRNTYYLGASAARVFRWANGELTPTDWRARGLDLNGIFR
jgi:parallel beta-helix repeat protein